MACNVHQTQYRLHNVHDSRLLHGSIRVENLLKNFNLVEGGDDDDDDLLIY